MHDLRERAKRAIAARRLRFTVILDDAARERIAAAEKTLTAAREALEGVAPDAKARSVADKSPKAKATDAVADAEKALADAWKTATPDTITLVFRPAGIEHLVLIGRLASGDGIPAEQFTEYAVETFRMCYDHAEDPTGGDNIGMPADEALALLSPADMDTIVDKLMALNMKANLVPFVPPSSGATTTNSTPA